MEGVQVINFADLKKGDKKSKKKKEKEVKDENVQEPVQKKEEPQVPEKKEQTKVEEVEIEPEFKHPFTYDQMLLRITEILNKTMQAVQQKFSVRPPELVKMQGKRTQCTNFVLICEQLNRNPEHICEFFLTELGTTGAVNEKSLILKGTYYIKSFESIISKYYNEFIKCPSCLGGNTDLEKDQQTRSYKLTCNQCKSSRYVKDIESGYQTLKKGQRRKERMK